MGAGASAQNGGSSKSRTSVSGAVSASKAAAKMKKKANQRNEGDFNIICRVVFDEADRNKNGKLDNGEFWYVLESVQLNLNLSPDEISEIRKLAEADGPLPPISYEQFVPMFRSLLNRVYAHNDNDWNDWCVCTDPKNNQKYYLNKRSGSIQKEKPANFHEERVEEQSFEYLTLDDGMELTTTVNAATGKRMYMDWDSQEWKEIPEHWLKQTATVKTDFTRGQTLLNITEEDTDVAVTTASHSHGTAAAVDAAATAAQEAVDPRVGQYMHPSRGLMHTYQFENTRNTRIYYDNRVNNWARMPLAWERNVDEVKVMLDELDSLIPRWKNVNEQLLTLRECNYDLQDAIIFAEINWGYKVGDTSETAKLDRTVTRAGFVADGQDVNENLGVLSAAAARKIDSLTAKLTEAETKIISLEKAKAEEEVATLRSLKRENTKLDAGMMRSQRQSEEAQTAILDLRHKLRESQAKLADSERERVASQADLEKISTLEEQVRALQKGGGDTEAAMKKSAQDMDRMRTENTHLKMKVQQMKQQLDSPVGGPATLNMLRTLHDKVIGIRREKDAMTAEFKEHNDAVAAVVTKAVSHAKGLELASQHKVEEITTKYRAEVLQRKLLYNRLQELQGNIRVFLRVRRDDADLCVIQAMDKVTALVPTLQGGQTEMEFDRVFGPEASQADVYEDTSAVIMSVIDGYNVCLMAYGQTGAGKTYTMNGTPDDPGVNRRAIAELLTLINKDDKLSVTLSASLAEVYNENVYDLLSAKRVVRKIKQGIQGVYADGLIERSVAVIEDVTRILKDGDRNRSVAATSMNTDSSRSHLIFTIKVTALNTISGVTTNGKLTLVDLAGSERIARSEATGERLIEAAAINKSLSALGQVFSAIAASSPHVPYRNSKLTHLLQDSLGGDSKTCMFVNASPLNINLSETHSTLSFGKQIRSIELGPAKKHTTPALGKFPAAPKV